LIDVLFARAPDVADSSRPQPRADFDCDGSSTTRNLGALIDYLFVGGGAPCNPYTP